MDINMTLLGQTIAMIVFVWFCMKYIWPPILAALEERQQQIEEGLAAADRSQEKLVQAQAEADGIVADARQQATGILDQAHAMSGNIDHYLTRARAAGQKGVFGSRTSLSMVVDDLKFAVERLYQDREISIRLCDKGDCQFRGEVQDLEEMLGNLLDNACKWARKHVEIRCRMQEDRMFISVEDDGPGIPEGKIETALKRGRKLDESVPGYGQGLGIVTEIASIYGGALKLGESSLGGLKVELELPALPQCSG